MHIITTLQPILCDKLDYREWVVQPIQELGHFRYTLL